MSDEELQGETNRVVTRKCPDCTRMIVFPAAATRIGCTHCRWSGRATDAVVPEYDVPPPDQRDHP